jgi:hypothetical protein
LEHLSFGQSRNATLRIARDCVSVFMITSCHGDNRNIYEGMIGYWYRLYRGDYGSIAYGNQVMYAHRNLWSGIGNTPEGRNTVIYSTLRFYLP